MEITVIEKNVPFEITVASKQEGKKVFYVGAGWDNPNGPVDLDLVAVALRGGKLTQQSDLIYFGNQKMAGISLSEDNTTGEGDGDDESIVISVDELPADVDRIVIGLASYSKGDFVVAPNPHFRLCDGAEETSEEVAQVKFDAATTGDTVLAAIALVRTSDGFVAEKVASFHQCGNGGSAIQGFANLYA